MTHLHWAFLARRELRQIEEITTRCGTVVAINDIAEDWGECRCQECLQFWGVSRMRELDRRDR